jgi:hypothetical protein
MLSFYTVTHLQWRAVTDTVMFCLQRTHKALSSYKWVSSTGAPNWVKTNSFTNLVELRAETGTVLFYYLTTAKTNLVADCQEAVLYITC